MSHSNSISSAQISKKPQTTRAQWIDTARGIAVFLVVFQHSLIILKNSLEIKLPQWLLLFGDFLILFRMPTLCLVSGIFLYKKVSEPKDKYWVNRVLRLGYLYFIWSMVYIIAHVAFAATSPQENVTKEFLHWAKITVTLHSELWYFFALMFFYAYWRVTLKIPKLVQLPVIIIFYILYASDTIVTSSWGWDHTFQYLLYFMFGAWFGPKILKTVPKLSYIYGAILTSIVFGIFTLYIIAGNREYFPWIETIAGPIALFWFIWMCSKIDDIIPVNSLTRFLGFRTLPIYALHFILLEAVIPLVGKILGTNFSTLEYILLPWFLTIIITLICLIIWKMTYKVAPFMYDLPRRFYR
ncbi:acyltransferase family protein [Rothia sp. P7208]|uniref:acyltransferase family protein n=1 Tax=Rothia sp. P7208 TaxID=3402660 RepID=UPI003ACBDEC9